MTTFALLLTTAVLWAGEVTVVKQLNGSTNDNAGTVTYSNGTITITPAQGNYITKDYVTVVKFVDAGIAQAPRRAPGVSEPITVTASDASADPSGVTTYTITPPSSEYDLEITANFQVRQSISNAVITLAETAFTYDGQEKTPAVSSVTVAGKALATNEFAVEYSDNINAGNGTVTISGLRTYNGTATADFTIGKATITPTVTLQGWTFGAQANSPVVDGNLGKGAETFTYAVKGSTDYSATVPTTAGTYTVKATIAETENYQGAEATADFTIGKATITPTVSIQGWTYGAEANTPVVDGNLGKGAETFTYAAKGSTDFSATVPSAAGTYTVKATISETENYQGAEATADFTIGKATITPTVSLQGWTFGAQANTPVVSGNTGNGTVTYTYAVKGSTTFSETVPTAAGTYTIKATISETENYQGAEATADFTIGKATFTPSVTLQGWTFGAQANTPVVSGNTGNGTVTFTYATKGSTDYSATVPTAAGTYTIKATIAETENYQGAEATSDFTISKATITPTVSLQGWTFGAQANTPVVDGNTGNGTVTYTYAVKGSTDYSATVPSAAGTYTVKATIAETENYQGAEATADFTIGKATITPSVTLQGWTFGAEPNSPVVSGNLGNGTVTYTYAVKGSTDYSASVPTAAGTYTVKATIAETENYQGAEATADFTIGKATITPTVTLQGWTFGAQANSPVVDGNLGNGTVTYTYTTKGSTDYSATVPSAAGTYTVKATIAETENYQGGEATADFTIGKATITPTVTLQGWMYGAQANSPVVDGNLGKGDETFTYAAKGSTDFSATVPSAAGTYTVKATIAETENYQGAEVTADFTIGKATFTPIVTLQGWAFGAEPNTPVVTGNISNGAVTFTYKAEGSETFTETVPTALGTHVVKASIAETENYQGCEATAEFTITAAVATITGEDQTVTYTGEPQAYNKGSVDVGTLVVTYYDSAAEREKGSNGYQNAPVNAGIYYVQLTQGDNHYTSAPVNITLTIEKGTPELSISEQQPIRMDCSSNDLKVVTPVVTFNGQTLTETFSFQLVSSDESVLTIDENGKLKAIAPGEVVVTVTGPMNHQNLNAATSTFQVSVYKTYGLIVAGVAVTSENSQDVLGNGSVKFNGKDQLSITNATIAQGGIESWMDKLTIYLNGDNQVNGAIVGHDGTLVFTTEGNTPGRLDIKNEGTDGVVRGFKMIAYEQNLALLTGSFEAQEAIIGTPVTPIVDESGETNTVDVDGGEGGEGDDYSNVIINNVLYTLDSDNDDGIGKDEDEDKKYVVLGSTMVEDDVEDVINNYTPGTQEFADHFAGLTFMVPAGYGSIYIKARTGEDGVLNVKIGNQEPYVIKGAIDFQEFEFPYACTEATYVYIYSSSPRRDAEALEDHRAGKKTTVTVGIGSVGVSSNSVQSSNGGDNTGGSDVTLTDDDVVYDEENGTLTASNSKVTTLADDSFVNFPFLQFIDLSNTSITGLKVSRSEGPFNGVSKNTFIYLPAGNSSDEPNVVIGNVSQQVVLDSQMSYEDNESFGLSKDFMAQQVVYDHIFAADEKAAVYLPFRMEAEQAAQYGQFYTFDQFKDGKAVMALHEEAVLAHTPYLFKAADDNTQLKAVGVLMSMSSEEAGARPMKAGRRAPIDASADLYGTYNFMEYDVFDPDVFRMAIDDSGKMTFQRLQDGEYLRPFECYLYAVGVQEDSFDVEGDGISTAVRTIRTDRVDYSDSWSGLSGLRFRTIPTQSGVYIHNHKKVVVK